MTELLSLPESQDVTRGPVSLDQDPYFASYANLSIHEDMLKVNECVCVCVPVCVH